MKKSTIFKIAIPVGIVVSLIVGISAYFTTYYKADDVSSYLESSEEVKVGYKDKYYFFDNVSNTEDVFIFYPGAKVDELAYAPILREIANSGIDVFLMKMPAHFALFDYKAANKIYKNYTYANYYLGGHSLGGAMAAQYTLKTSNKVDGLIFMASFSSKDLKSKQGLKALSIYGTNDGVLNMKSVEKGRSYFNEDSYKEVVIDGGNHGQFGVYGKQKGDNEATVNFANQKAITVNAVVDFIKQK